MNPMRVTAIAMILLGVIIAGFGIFSLMPAGDTATLASPPSTNPSAVPTAWVLFPFAGIAVVAGLGILLFGGKGAIRTRNPAVRN